MYELQQPTTIINYSPWDLLPAPVPKEESPEFGYFYDKVAKHLIKDIVRIMINGLPIDLTKVKELEQELDKTLANVNAVLSGNIIIKRYQSERYKKLHAEFIADRTSKLRTSDYYIKPFNHKDMTHRSYFMSVFAEKVGLSSPSEQLPTGVPKWTAKQVKQFVLTYPRLTSLLEGKINENNSDDVKVAMLKLAEDKANLHNRKYEDQIKSLDPNYSIKFNPSNKKHIDLYLTLEKQRSTID